MAWSATHNDWFRNTVVAALTVPVTGNAAGSTVALAGAAGHTIKVALYDNSLGVVNYNTEVGYGAGQFAAGELANGNGYTTGGASLTSPTLTSAGASPNETITFSFASSYAATWGATATFNTYGGLVYDSASSMTNKWGIISLYFGGVMSPSTGTFTIQWTSAGIWTIA